MIGSRRMLDDRLNAEAAEIRRLRRGEPLE
jgi:hypothetical protein